MTELIVRRMGGRLVLELPDALASQVPLREGDLVEIVDLRAGGFGVKVLDDKSRQVFLGLAAMDRLAETYQNLSEVEGEGSSQREGETGTT